METELMEFGFLGYCSGDGYGDSFSHDCGKKDCKFYQSIEEHECEIELKNGKLICLNYEPTK